jgi:hypothetical protein
MGIKLDLSAALADDKVRIPGRATMRQAVRGDDTSVVAAAMLGLW